MALGKLLEPLAEAEALGNELRAKLGAAGAYIETVRGVGYRFSPEKRSEP